MNELVSFPADGSGEPRRRRTRGRDFYAAPRAGPDGRLAYLAWDHPLLPFLGCELWVDGEKVAGGADEAIFQPEWGPDGALYWVSDAGDGWWNLYRDGERLTALEAELGYPAWIFGMRTYGFLDERPHRVHPDRARHCTRSPCSSPRTGELERARPPVHGVDAVRDGARKRFAILAGAPAEPVGIHVVDSQTGAYETVVRQNVPPIEPASISEGRAIEFEFARANRARLLLSADECRLRGAGGREAAAPRRDPRRADVAGEARLPPLHPVLHLARLGGRRRQLRRVDGLRARVSRAPRIVSGASSTSRTASPPRAISPRPGRSTPSAARSSAAARAGTRRC